MEEEDWGEAAVDSAAEAAALADLVAAVSEAAEPREAGEK